MSRKAQRGVSLRVGFLAATAGVLLALSIFAIVWSTSLFAPVREPARDSDLTLRIGRGESFRAVAADLVRLGWVSSALPIRWEARRRGWDRRVFPGYYRWRRGERVHELLARLARGEVEETKLTFPEGWGAKRILTLLADSTRVPLVDLVRTATDTTWLRAHEVPGPGIEGYLVPDTYRLPKGESADLLLARLVSPGVAFYRDSLEAQATLRGLTRRQLWTLASIVEAEAARAEERPLISAVFWNRLKLGMRLESDPTVLYALGRAPGRVTFADLAVDSPYNTYRNAGLPPGPICCPGRDALRAAARPNAGVDALFFVARGDGTHVFSRTFAQHGDAIRAVRATRKLAVARTSEPPRTSLGSRPGR